MKQAEIILIILAAAGLLLWLLWRLGRLRDALRREREENLHLRELLQMGNQMAQTDLEQLRKLRHDLRQYLILTEERSLSPDSASTLRNALEELPAESRRESWAMSVLEQYYLDQANALGFQTDLHITPPLDWEGAIPDLCLVLSNLLENSLEALQREGGGWLRARSVSAAGYFSLVIGNSCTRPLRTFNGRYLSSKAPGRTGSGPAVRRSGGIHSGRRRFPCLCISAPASTLTFSKERSRKSCSAHHPSFLSIISLTFTVNKQHLEKSRCCFSLCYPFYYTSPVPLFGRLSYSCALTGSHHSLAVS